MSPRVRNVLFLLAGAALLVLVVIPLFTVRIKVEIPPPVAETAK